MTFLLKRTLHLLSILLVLGSISGCVTSKPAKVETALPPPPPPVREGYYESLDASAQYEAQLVTAYLESQSYLGEGDFLKSLLTLRKAVRENPKYNPLYPDLLRGYSMWLGFLTREPDSKLWNDALSWYQKADRYVAPEDLNTVIDIGIETAPLFVEAGRLGESIQLYRSLLGIGAEEYRARMAMGEIYLALRQDVEAEAQFKRCLEINPDGLAVVVKLFEALINQEKNDEAAELVTGVRDRNPNDIDYKRLEALLLTRQKEYERAAELYESFIEDLPVEKRDEIRLEAVYLYERLDNREKLVYHLEKAQESSTTSLKATQQLIEFYLTKKEYDNARASIKRMASFFPSQEEKGMLMYGLYSMARRDFDPAIEMLQELVQRDTDFLEAYTSLFQAHLFRKDFEQAASVARTIQLRFPDLPVGCRMEATTYQAQEKYKPAIKLLRGCLEDYPNSMDLVLALAMCEERAGNWKEAEGLLQEVIASQPMNATALNYLGYSYADKGINLETAEDYIRRAVTIEPSNGAYLDSLGWVLYKQGKFADAVEYLEKAARLTDNDPVVLEHLGDCLYRLRDVDGAVHIWEKALPLANESAKDIVDGLQEKIKRRTIIKK